MLDSSDSILKISRYLSVYRSGTVLEIVQTNHQLRKLLGGNGPNCRETQYQKSVKIFPHLFYNTMLRHELSESLLSNRQEKGYQGDEDLRRLRRKFIPSLPEQQTAKISSSQQSRWHLPVFNPQSTFIIIWQVTNIILIYVYFMQIPIAITFGNHRTGNQLFFQTINFPVMFIFLLNIFVNLNTSFYQDGQLQKDSKQIRKHYLKKNLAFDVVSLAAIFFYEMVQIFQLSKDYFRFVVLIFFLRLKQLLRVERVIINSFDLNRRVKAAIKLLLLLLKILLICNVVACGGYMLSDYLSDHHVIKDDRVQECDSSSYWIISTCEANISLKYIETFTTKYIYSLYWASTTMISIGYGDITPKNSYEVGYTICMQFLSCLLYGYAINEIWSIIQELNSKKSTIHSRLNTINIYMRDKQIGSDLTNRINGYLNNYYYSKNLRQRDREAEIIGQLTPSLKKQLFYQSYSIVLKHRFFNSITDEVIIEASQHVKEVCCYQDEILTESQELSSSCLYYLKKGELKQETGGKCKIRLQTQYTGDHIGIYEFVTQMQYLSELTASKYSLAYYLKFSSWKRALLEDALCFQYFYLVKERLLLNKELDRIGYTCYFCSLRSHRSELCFDQFLRNEILKRYEMSRKSQNNHRRPYFRRRIRVNIVAKRKRRRSMHRGQDMFHLSTRQRSNSLVFNIHALDLHNEDMILTKSRKKSDESEIQLTRGGRIIGRHTQKHQNHKALQKVQRIYHEEQEQSYQSIPVEIKMQDVDIDQLANYQEYYPSFNPSELTAKEPQRRRATKSFYFFS